MDDPRFTPHLLARLFPFARPAVAGAPARARPNRPIPYESFPRLTPSAPPPWSQREPERPSWGDRLARVGVGVLLALGWLVFAAWWTIVLRRESTAALGRAAGLLGAILVSCAVIMVIWTRYNIWVARRGNRGRSSLYIPMQWERDTLGRALELPAAPIAHSATEVRITVRDGVKSYVVAREAER